MRAVISSGRRILYKLISPTPRSRALLFVLGQNHEDLCTNYLNLVVRFAPQSQEGI